MGILEHRGRGGISRTPFRNLEGQMYPWRTGQDQPTRNDVTQLAIHGKQTSLRPKRCLLAVNRKLRDIVASRLILASPPRVHLTFKVPKRSSGNASSSSMFKNPHNLRSPN